MAEKSSKASGLKLTRKKDKFTASWKQPKGGFEKQYVGYRVLVKQSSTDTKSKTKKTKTLIPSKGEWKDLSSDAGKKTKSFTLKRDNFYPYSGKSELSSVEVIVKGKQKGKAENENTYSFPAKKPPAPKVTTTTLTWPKCKFAWEVKSDATDKKWFTRVQYQSVLKYDSPTTAKSLSEKAWSETYPGSTKYDTIEDVDKTDGNIQPLEDSTIFDADGGKASFTRYFRIRSLGPGGHSKWVYGSHIYAKPMDPVVRYTYTTINREANKYIIQVWFHSYEDNTHPVTNYKIKSAIATFGEGLTFPSSITFGEAKTLITRKNDETSYGSFELSPLCGDDQGIFIQLQAVYDSETVDGPIALVKESKVSTKVGSVTNKELGYTKTSYKFKKYEGPEYSLKSPTAPETTTHIIEGADYNTVEFRSTNRSEVPGSSLIAVYYNTSDPAYRDGYILGTVESGVTETLRCPKWNTGDEIYFGVYAEAVSEDETWKITSNTVKQTVPLPTAPEITAVRTDTAGTIRVTWGWIWDRADAAEVSWADHKDAWESTDEPSTYTVSKSRPAALNISGLEAGIKWYIRVRLISGNGDEVSYGEYSDISEVMLSTAPIVPTLSITPETVTEDGQVTISWIYFTTDGSNQGSAEIREIVEGVMSDTAIPGGEISGDVQSMSVVPSQIGWHNGENHTIVVRTISENGLPSEDWSAPATLHVVAKPTIEITDTSLEWGNVHVNPRVYTGDLVTFETDDYDPVTSLTTDLEPIQDLHGYDSPWPGGASRNKLPKPVAGTYTANGITLTVDDLGVITVSGTATSGGTVYVPLEGSYVIPTAVSNGGNGTMFVGNSFTAPNGNGFVLYNTAGSGLVDTWGLSAKNRMSYGYNAMAGKTIDTVALQFLSGQTFDGTIKPMFTEDSTTTLIDYIPYSNICPISGWTGQTVMTFGKNLLDLNRSLGTLSGYAPDTAREFDCSKYYMGLSYNNYYDHNSISADFTAETGEVEAVSSYSAYCVAFPVRAIPEQMYDVSFEVTEGAPYVSVTYYDHEGKYIRFANSRSPFSTTAPNNAYIMVVGVCKSGQAPVQNENAVKGLCVSLHSTVADYSFEPYAGTTYTRSFVDGQGNTLTVYGGEDEIVGGVLTVDKAMVTLNGADGNTYRNNGHTDNTTRAYIAVQGKKSGVSNIQSDKFYYSPYAGDVVGKMVGRAANNGIEFYLPPDVPDATADVKAWFANNPTQLVYELDTPQTYQLTANEVETLIGTNHVWSDVGEVTVDLADVVQEGWLLTKMPLTVTVSGAGENDTATVHVERSREYRVDRPDESNLDGYEDEMVLIDSRTGNGDVSFDILDLMGRSRLDDGAEYRIVASVQDNYGQSSVTYDRTTYDDSEESGYQWEFTVKWDHQAEAPTVETEIDEENEVAILRPLYPISNEEGSTNILKYSSKSAFPITGESRKLYVANDTGIMYWWEDTEYVENTDRCDIYRLSVDKPVLIYKGATFGETYVDPYPTIGEYGGHRFVTVTANGDYTVGDYSETGQFAWSDTRAEEGDIFETHSNIIDFGSDKVHLLYEVDLSNNWSKDFKETKYLGGSVQGDWNPAVSRSSSLSVTTVSDLDQETIQSMRRLAVYPGICHVRTKDGSSYAANIDVNETYKYTRAPRFNEYSLSITRVDPERYDGMLYSEWLGQGE